MDETSLSVAALDSALQGAKTGALLLSESLTVRTRALLGKAKAAADGSSSGGGDDDGGHWSEDAGVQRLTEVMSRMAGDRRLLEKLLLHGFD